MSDECHALPKSELDCSRRMLLVSCIACGISKSLWLPVRLDKVWFNPVGHFLCPYAITCDDWEVKMLVFSSALIPSSSLLLASGNN